MIYQRKELIAILLICVCFTCAKKSQSAFIQFLPSPFPPIAAPFSYSDPFPRGFTSGMPKYFGVRSPYTFCMGIPYRSYDFKYNDFSIGMFGGFKYEDKEIQTAINETFVSQQEKVKAAAILEAQTDKNATIELEAKGLANAAVTKAQGEAEAIKIKAEAEAGAIAIKVKAVGDPKDFIETERLKVWDGKYPQWYMGGQGNGDLGLIINPPVAAAK